MIAPIVEKPGYSLSDAYAQALKKSDFYTLGNTNYTCSTGASNSINTMPNANLGNTNSSPSSDISPNTIHNKNPIDYQSLQMLNTVLKMFENMHPGVPVNFDANSMAATKPTHDSFFDCNFGRVWGDSGMCENAEAHKVGAEEIENRCPRGIEIEMAHPNKIRLTKVNFVI